jgi:hypothetical protein
MIPAKISNLNPVQVTYYKEPYPLPLDETIPEWERLLEIHEASKFIADVENVWFSEFSKVWFIDLISVNIDSSICNPLIFNQQVFIEETTEGKCKIVKL